MIKRLLIAIALLAPTGAQAHFLEVWPSPPMVTPSTGSEVDFRIAFGHPFTGQVLDLAPLTRFEVTATNGTSDILGSVKTKTPAPLVTYGAEYTVGGPGDYIFVAGMEPYWEAEEDTYIQQITKVVVNVGGEEGDWDRDLGLPVEIVPLSRPYAVWAGSTFTGQVMVGGKPAPDVTVEVTLARGAQRVTPLSELHDVATIKTDANGVFTYGLPAPGWWGFSAITHSEETRAAPGGGQKPIELDAVLWVRADAF